MSMSVDEKVVSMKFDNKQFEKGVAESMKTIDKLNKSTDLKGAKKGFDELEKSASKMDFSKVASNVDSLAKRFSAMGIAGMTVIQDITSGALNMGKKIAGALAAPLNQIKSGGISRAMNLEQAKFQIEGLGQSWEKLQEDINYGVESTAYGLDAAAKAAAQLSASGIQAGNDMKASLRGISGVAAMTNSSYEDISRIYTTVAGNGRLMSEQLLQLSSRGINAAATLSQQLGKSEQEIREMVSKGKIDFATFSKAMDDAFGEHAKDANKTFEGSISNVKAALSKIGALFAQPVIQNAIEPINALRENLNQIKGVLEEKGGLAESFGKFTAKLSGLISAVMTNENFLTAVRNGAKGLVSVFNVLTSIFKRVASAFQQVFPPKTVQQLSWMAIGFANWAKSIKLSEETLGRIQAISRGVFSVFKIMVNVVGLLKDIFIDIAKSPVGDFLFKLAAKIGDVITTIGQFVYGFRMLYKTASQTFGGIGGIFRNFGTFLKALGMLFAQTIGRIIPGFSQIGEGAKQSANVIIRAFSGVIAILKLVWNGIKKVATATWDFIKQIMQPFVNIVKRVANGVSGTIGKMVDSITNVFTRGDKAAENTVMFKVLSAIAMIIKVVIAVLAKLGALLRDVFVNVVKEIGTAGLGNVIEKLLNISILLSVKGFVEKFKKLIGSFGEITGAFSGTLSEVKNSLQAFQKNMQTKRLVEIAVAVGLLAGALILLSTLKPEKMAVGLAALAGTMTILIGAMLVLQKFGGDKKMATTSMQIMGLAAAVLILSKAVKSLAGLDMKEIGKGLLALAGTMAIMVAAVKILGTGGKKVMKGALQLIFLAQAVKTLAAVVKDLSGMDWSEMGKGLAGLGGILLELVIFSKIMNKTKIRLTTATSILIIVQALKQIIKPVKELGAMDWKTLGTGLGAIGALLAELAIFAGLMSKFGKKLGLFKATAILIIVNAVKTLVEVVKELGGADIGVLAKGLGSVGIVLTELAAFAAVLGKTKGIFIDSVGILILVKALNNLVPVIQSLGGNDVVTLAKGLGSVAVALIAICTALRILGKGKGVLRAALSFAVVAKSINTMAASIKMLGVLKTQELAQGLIALVATIGALTAAVKLMKGSVAGAAAMLIVANALLVLAPAVAVLGNMPFDSMITAIIGLAGALGSIVLFGKLAGSCVPGILALAGALAIIGVAFVAFGAGVVLFGIGINTIVDAAVKVKDASKDIVNSFKVFGSGIAAAIIGIAKGLAKGATTIAKSAAIIVVKIVKAIAEKMPEIVDAAYNLILNFINGLAEGAEKYLPKIMDAIGKLMGGIVKGLKAWFEQFTQLGVAGVAKIIGAILLILGLFKLLSKAISGFKKENIAGALIMVAGIIAITVALTKLSEVPWANLIAAAAALSGTLLAFTGAMEIISKVKLNVAQMGIFLLGALSLAEIAAALMIAATQPWQQLIVSAAAILAVLAGYTAVFELISKIKMDPQTLASLAIFALGLLALIPVVMAIQELAKNDYKSLLGAATSIVEVFLGYAAVFKVMSMIPIPAAIAAIANMAIAVLGITALLAILGAIRQIPGFDWLIGEGGQVLMKLGEIMGGFVGSIIAGFGKAVSSLLPKLGADLGAFFVNASPFFMGMKLIDSSTISAVETLAGAILTLSGGALLDGIARFLGSDFTDLGSQLAGFAHGVVDFAEITKDLDGEKVASAAYAAALLGGLAGDLPLEGGLLGALIGDRLPVDKFGEQLPKLGEGVKAFAESVDGISEDSIKAGLNAAQVLSTLAGDMPLDGGLLGAIVGDRLPLDKLGEQLPQLGEGISDFASSVQGIDESSITAGMNAAKMLVALSGETPLEGGILGGIIGDRLPLDKLGEQLPKLGEGLSEFAKNTEGLDMTAVAKGDTAAKMMIALSQEMPTTGGLWGLLAGNSDTLDEFGDRLPALGSGLKQFADNVAGLDVNAATNATTIAQMLSALATNLPDEGGIGSWFTGDNTLEDFADELPTLGDGLLEFSNKVSGMDTGAVNAATGSIRSVTYMMETYTKAGITLQSLTDLSNGLKVVGEGYRKMAAEMAGASTIGIENFKNGVASIIESVKKINKVDTSKVQKFFDSVKGLSDVGIKDISTAAKDSVDKALSVLKKKADSFKSVGKSIINCIKKGIESAAPTLQSTSETISSNVISGMDSKQENFVSAGNNAAKGFISGMKEYISNARKAGQQLGNAADSGIKQSLDIHSPSKKAKKSGENVGKGFKQGMNSQEQNARNAGQRLAGNAAIGLESKNSLFGDAGNNAANSYINKFQSVINGSGINKFMDNKSLNIKDVSKKLGVKVEKKKEEKPKTKNTSTFTGGSGTSTNTKKSGGGGGGSSKKDEFTKKDAKKAQQNYKEIVGTFVKDTKDFSKKFLKAGTNKKSGVAFVHVTAKYIQSAVKNKSLRTAVNVFGSGLAKSINKSLDVELKKNKAYKKLEKKATASGKKLVAAKEAKKEAQSVIKSSKSSQKQIAAAKKDLAKANKDIKKYQGEVDKYGKKMKKVANSTAKSITTRELKKTTTQFKQFKTQFNGIQKGLGKSLSKLPTVVGSYIKNSKTASSQMTGAAKKFNKLFGDDGGKAIDKYAKKMYESSDEYKNDIKTVKDLNKKHNKNVEKATELHNKIKKTSNKKLKKKYADELAQLKKDDKALIKQLNKTVTNIAKGPAKALKAYKKQMVESYKSFVNISNWEISPRFDLQGFEAMGNAAAKFSIFGDISAKAAKSFDMFGSAVSGAVDDVAEAFDVLNNSMDTGMNMLERFTKTGTVEKEALIENADSQLEAYEEFYNGIDELRRKGFSDEVVENLESQGPQALNYIRGFLNMNEEERDAYNARMEKKYQWEAKTLERNMQRQLSQYEKFNAQIEQLAAQGLSEGIVNKLKQSGVSQAAYVRAMLHMDSATMNSVKDIYAKSVSYGTTAAVAVAREAGDTTGLSYREALHKQIDKDKEWEEKLKRLADTKLHPDIIQQFREMGAEAAEGTVDSILAETKAGIDDINALYDQYLKTSTVSFLEAAKKNKDAAEKYNETMNRLQKEAVGLDPGILKYIQSLGEEEAMAYANSILGHLEDIPKINELYWESGQADVDTMIRNINSQSDFTEIYEANLAKLDKAFSDLGAEEKKKYIQYLKDMGLEGADLVAALANASEEKIQEYRDAIDRREKLNEEERARATMEAFQKRINAINSYADKIKQLTDIGINPTLLNDIAKIGETDPAAAAEKAEDLLNMYRIDPKKFEELNASYAEYMKKGASNAIDTLVAEYAKGDSKANEAVEKIANKSKKAGKESVKSYSAGVDEGLSGDLGSQVVASGKKMGKKLGSAATKETAKQIGSLPVESVATAMDETINSKATKKKIKKIGSSVVNGLASGITESSESALNAAKTVANGIYNKFNNKLTNENGRNTSTNFVSAIKAVFNAYYIPLTTLANNISSDVYTAFSTRLSYSNGYYFGSQLAAGLVQGLNDTYPSVRTAADQIIQKVNEALAAKAKIQSPSKVWRYYGNMLGEGLAYGIADETKRVTSVTNSLIDNSVGSLQDTISAISAGLENDMVLNPVITPTLDLSKVTMQARRLNSMIDNANIAANVRTEELSDAQNQNGGVVQNFVQNNYSPKALSREEIYRQTKNQFALAKEAVRV